MHHSLFKNVPNEIFTLNDTESVLSLQGGLCYITPEPTPTINRVFRKNRSVKSNNELCKN